MMNSTSNLSLPTISESSPLVGIEQDTTPCCYSPACRLKYMKTTRIALVALAAVTLVFSIDLIYGCIKDLTDRSIIYGQIFHLLILVSPIRY